MKLKHIIIGLVILFLVVFFTQKNEHAGSTTTQSLSNESIQNIASVYANTTGTSVFNNIRVSGNATIKSIKSPNGAYSFAIQDDGNLVISDRDGKPVWDRISSSNRIVSPNGQYKLFMKDDGNFILSDRDGKPVWDRISSSNRVLSPNGEYTLYMKDDGNFVLSDKEGKPLWDKISNSQKIISPDGKHTLEISNAPNVAIYTKTDTNITKLKNIY
jgi:hypothetical protein